MADRARIPVHSFGEPYGPTPDQRAFNPWGLRPEELSDEDRREYRRRKRELYLFLFHLTLACVPAHLFCAFLLYLLYWSK